MDESIFANVATFGVCIAGLVAFVSLLTWRSLIKAVLCLMLLDCLVRRFVLNIPAVLLIKDAILVVAYIKAVLELRGSKASKNSHVSSLITLILVALIVICLAEFVNSTGAEFLVSIFGLRSWLIYVPLLYLAPYCFQDRTQLRESIKRYLLIGCVICYFGLVQQYLGKDSVLSKTYATENRDTKGTYDGYELQFRSCSTFQSNGPFADYTLFIMVLTGTCIQLPRMSLRKWQVGVLLCAIAGAIISSGSTYVGTIAVGVLPFMFVTGRRLGKPMFWLVLLVVVGCFVAPVLSDLVPEFIKGGLARSGGAVSREGYVAERLRLTFIAPLQEGLKTPFGHGLGLASRGVSHAIDLAGAENHLSGQLGFEGGYGMVLWEIGLPGFLIFITLQAALFIATLRRWRRGDDLEAKRFAMAAVVVQVSLALGMTFTQKLDASVFAILYWFTCGLGLGTARIPERRNKMAKCYMLPEMHESSSFTPAPR